MAKYAGEKFAGSHTTAIDAADPIIEEALRRPEVNKIVLGLIKSGKQGGNPGLKTVDIDHGLKCTVRGNTGIQELYVYTSDRHATASALHAVAPAGRGKQKNKARKDPEEPIHIRTTRAPRSSWPF